jgi:predicted ATPase
MRPKLEKVTIKGFKTIRDLTLFEPGSLSVLIGPNGVGKSNFISFFRLLSWALRSSGNLQSHVGELGGASALLFDGPDRTREIEAELTFKTDTGTNQYNFRLVYAAGDTLIYAQERFRFLKSEVSQGKQAHEKILHRQWIELNSGHRESLLISRAESADAYARTAKTILWMLNRVIVHQFHNTSGTSRMRGKWDVEDNRWLKEDAGNIAPFLYRLHENEPACYRRIIDTIRLILPFFEDFILNPDYGRLLLQWREQGSDRIFNASQAADGMLRVIALISLLLQPEKDLPEVIILDEPELGLHPYAIKIIGGLIRSAATTVQVIVATQSASLVDCFVPEDIVVVDRKDRTSNFRRLNPEELQEWLQEYSLSELWEKNVLGGRP